MTDKKDKDTKVRAIRAGIVVDNDTPKLEALPQVVNVTELLDAAAKNGSLRELCFVAIYADETSNRGIVGEPYNFTLTQSHLLVLVDDYFESATRPFLTGEYQDQFDE